MTWLAHKLLFFHCDGSDTKKQAIFGYDFSRLAACLTVACVQQLRRTVHEVVGRINGHYGTLTHVPIHHLDRSLSFQELCALYAITDVLLVTSLRDGMNLVSYEYVACQSDNAGKTFQKRELSTHLP